MRRLDERARCAHGRLFVPVTINGMATEGLLDSGATLDFIRQVKPDAIIHLAAISGGIGLSIKHPASMLRDNVLLNFNVIEAARLCGVKKTVMTLTTGMYPPDAPLPLTEPAPFKTA